MSFYPLFFLRLSMHTKLRRLYGGTGSRVVHVIPPTTLGFWMFFFGGHSPLISQHNIHSLPTYLPISDVVAVYEFDVKAVDWLVLEVSPSGAIKSSTVVLHCSKGMITRAKVRL
ncbi:uncharacterized protein A4U43_C06F170 [Asparagus officinalis]|uniref:Uncharacterized protein n=1 Tax=Asparagus officinalis TaxID=4686 RepID=A0A5P1EIZ1_ASPOF|nr:uncharacterized protein A4U43_C06F170 [Asparagus officinalis]